MPQNTEITYPTMAEGGRMDAAKSRNIISNSGRGGEDGCHKRQKQHIQQWQKGERMPQKAERKYLTVPDGGRVDATQDRNNISNSARVREGGCHKRQKIQRWQREGGWMPQKTDITYPTVAEGGRMDATKDRNKISNSGRGREDGCHKRQKSNIQQWQREGGWMPQKDRNKISNSGRGREGGRLPQKTEI